MNDDSGDLPENPRARTFDDFMQKATDVIVSNRRLYVATIALALAVVSSQALQFFDRRGFERDTGRRLDALEHFVFDKKGPTP